jgi:hypothetical protein
VTFVVMALVAVAPWQSLDGGARAAQVEALKSLPLEARFAAASEGFLGTPYVLSPLGEGAGYDPDPLLRYDAADCLTMVEQSLALAVTPDEARVIETLNHIRYEGAPSYEGRLHVMEAQWLPVNLARGLLEDVTRRYGKDVVKRVSKRITKETWAEKGGVSLGLSPAGQATGEFFLDIVPSERAPAVLSTAPEGLIVVVVRADRPRLVTRVTHVAILVQKPSGPFLRHASRSFKRVVDEPVEKYLKRNLEFGAWTQEAVHTDARNGNVHRARNVAGARIAAPVAVVEAREACIDDVPRLVLRGGFHLAHQGDELGAYARGEGDRRRGRRHRARRRPAARSWQSRSIRARANTASCAGHTRCRS